MTSQDRWRPQLDPNLTRGDEAKRQGDLLAAEAAYRAGLAHAAPRERGMFRARLGDLLAAQDRVGEQEAMLRAAVEHDDEPPTSLEWSYRVLAGFVGRSGNTGDERAIAREGVRRLERIGHGPWLLRTELAESLAKAGHHAEAIAEYERVMTEAADSPGYSRQHTEEPLGMSLIALGRVSEAEFLVSRHHASGRFSALTHPLADVYAARRQWDRIEALYRAAYAAASTKRATGEPLNPRSSVFAVARVDDDEPLTIDLAERWARELGDPTLANEIAHQRGLQAERRGDITAAIGHYAALGAARSRFEPTHERLLALLEDEGRYSEALTHARSVMDMGLSARLTVSTRRRIERLERLISGKRAAPRGKEEPPFLIRHGEPVAWQRLADLGGRVRQVDDLDGVVTVVSGSPDRAVWQAQAGGSLTRMAGLDPSDQVIAGPFGGWLVLRSERTDGGQLTHVRVGARSGAATIPGSITDAVVAPWGMAVATPGGLIGFDHQLANQWQVDGHSGQGQVFATPQGLCRAVRREAGPLEVESLAPDGQQLWTWEAPAEADDWPWRGPVDDWYLRARAARALGVDAADAGAAWRRTASIYGQMSKAERSSIAAPLRAYEIIAAGFDGWATTRLLAPTSSGGVVVGVGPRLAGINGHGHLDWSTTSPNPADAVVLDSEGSPVAASGRGGVLLYTELRPAAALAVSAPGVRSIAHGSAICVVTSNSCSVVNARGELQHAVEFAQAIRGAASRDGDLWILSGGRVYALTL